MQFVPSELLNSLICGDNRAVFEALPDSCVDLILTDPPYKTYRSNRPVAKPKQKWIRQEQFDSAYFAQQSFRVLKPGRHLYCFCDHRTFPEIRAQLIDAGFTYKNCLVWVKNNHGSGDLRGDWAPQHEFIIFATKGKGDKLRGKRPANVLSAQKIAPHNVQHGAAKPVELLRKIIRVSSDPGDVVLDPYGGSAATAEACLLEGRPFILVELDEEYLRTAQIRLTALTRNFESIKIIKL